MIVRMPRQGGEPAPFGAISREKQEMTTALRVSAILVACGASLAHADIVVPNANTNTPGTSGLNTLVREATNARTYQALIDSSQLAGVGTITGLSFRLQNSAANATSWPAAPITWPNYEVILSTSPNAASAIGTTFAANIGGDAVTVRSGALTIPANAFSGGAAAGTPNAFFLLIPFLSNFNYAGGTLSITVRHTGNDAAAGNVRFLDAVASNGALGYSCITATGNTATTGAASTFIIANIVPAPGSLALVVLGGLAAIRRRR
jgi:hypothetical protein